MLKSAIISPCKKYRYQLERRTTKRAVQKSTVTFIGLNPSTADASADDPTIRKCIAYTQSWNFKTLLMVNLFAWRTSEPNDLLLAEEPVGRDNDEYIADAVSRASLVVACWGEHGTLHHRADEIAALYRRRLHGIKVNRSGQPSHPLYLPAALKPEKLAKLVREQRKRDAVQH